MKAMQKEKENELRKLQEQWEKKEGKRAEAERKKIAVLEKKVKRIIVSVMVNWTKFCQIHNDNDGINKSL